MNSKSDSGFNLVEVLVASAILALIIAGFMTAFTQASRMQYFADRHYVASILARNRVEYAKVYPFGSLDGLAETNTAIDAVGDADAISGQN